MSCTECVGQLHGKAKACITLWGKRCLFPLARGSAHGQIHNVYGQTMIMGTYEGLQKIYAKKAADKLSSPAQRPFIIARGGYAGSFII